MHKHIELIRQDDSHIVKLSLILPCNLIGEEVLFELGHALDTVDADPSIRVLIMESSRKHTGFGADLNELVLQRKGGELVVRDKNVVQMHIGYGRIIASRLFHLRKPVIGVIKGYCLGGIAELFLCCDVLYGAAGGIDEGGLIYGFPEPTIGVMPGWFGPEILIHKIGAGHALDLLLSGRKISGVEALQMGIVQTLYPVDELSHRAMEWANQVAANAPNAVMSIRLIANRALFPDFDEVIVSTDKETAKNIETKDFLTGVTAFFSKKKIPPEFTGE